MTQGVAKSLTRSGLASKAMLIVSGYKNRLYSKYLNSKTGWTARSIATTTRGTKGKTIDRIEILWVNQAFKNAVKTGKIPVRLSKAESAEKKINPERKSRKSPARKKVQTTN